MKIALLGGGLTGLTIGCLLSNNTHVDFEVLEKEFECGGLMRTLYAEGFSFDYGGSHIVFSKNDESLNFIRSLLKKNRVRNRRNTKVLYKNCFIKYPFENGLSDLSKEENFECLFSFIQNLFSKEKGKSSKPDNLKEWFYHTFGKGIAEKYLIPYNEKIWKFSVDQMGLDWVERIPDPPIEDIVKSSLGIETEGYKHQLYFYYPKTGGIEAITKVLKEKIDEHVTTGYDVKKIKKEGNQWIVSDGQIEKFFDKIISTIPIHKLVAAVDAPKNVRTAAKALKYNSLITVMLGVNKNKLNDLSWLYIPDKSVLTHRVSFPSNYSPYVAPPKKSSVLAEITCNFRDKLWTMTDDRLVERTTDDLSRLGLIDKKDVCFAKVQRTEYAYVISDLEYNANLKIVTKYFDELGIGLVGRFAEFKYLNMDACIESAMNYVKINYPNSS
ncbi:MAG: protoporphyrinogen/coproporphyrinogen oxidase [Candidatus Bathyarchaeia archaeon]|jgi:protoporphyrinogen oxidase